jgi:hypothetical protein
VCKIGLSCGAGSHVWAQNLAEKLEENGNFCTKKNVYLPKILGRAMSIDGHN